MRAVTEFGEAMDKVKETTSDKAIEKALSEAEKLLDAEGDGEPTRTSSGQEPRADVGYRGHKPQGVSRRAQKRGMARVVRAANRRIRRQARKGITCSGPSEKAQARG